MSENLFKYILFGEHPFNLKGGGGYGCFWGKTFLSANLIENNFVSLKWAEKKFC